MPVGAAVEADADVGEATVVGEGGYEPSVVPVGAAVDPAVVAVGAADVPEVASVGPAVVTVGAADDEAVGAADEAVGGGVVAADVDSSWFMQASTSTPSAGPSTTLTTLSTLSYCDH